MNHVIDLWIANGSLLPAESYDSEGGSALLWLLGPVAGVAFYLMVFLRYRNTNKRHAYERETSSEVLDMRVHDQVVGEVTGVERSSIQGMNSRSPRSRLGAGTRVTQAPAAENPEG